MVEDKLDLTFYKGEDIYSDGDIEDELLKIVQENEDCTDILLNDHDWAKLYHLSPVRQNVLDWYDFNPNGTVLEIGAGCGAITGLLCKKTKQVTCIDLSKRRSMINATRNKAFDNLKIYVGNFTDIKLEEKFDYVTLIGVFEYSIAYVGGKRPFEEMLERASSFLKPGGKLIIAIENKYGLKYFAGATEDHTGKLFDGIENYADVDRVRTFSRGSLEDLLVKAGFSKNEFYYPMPDYKMPTEIYSDDYMPNMGAIRGTMASLDRERYAFFDESKAFDSICKDRLFPEFANSFLVFSSKED